MYISLGTIEVNESKYREVYRPDTCYSCICPVPVKKDEFLSYARSWCSGRCTFENLTKCDNELLAADSFWSIYQRQISSQISLATVYSCTTGDTMKLSL